MTTKPLRIVTFNFLPIAYDLLTNWIHATGNQHVLAVTTPGPKSRPTPSYKGIVEKAPRDVDILVTTRLKSVATPLIRALQPDLIACFSFPYRITPELCQIPTYGAVNLHPAVLPAYRGPNVMRQFYEGAPAFGATLHWIAAEYDTGNILSQKSAPMPAEVTRNIIIATWPSLMMGALTEGIARAIAGEAGQAQDDAQASYAAPFSDEEAWLNLSEPQRVLQRKETALNMLGPGSAKVMVDQQPYTVMSLELLPPTSADVAPGHCLEKSADALVVQAADGPVRITVKPIMNTTADSESNR
ncbi:MAG: formyltransferase family protein [Caldilineaceae bacterium]